ncbi:MAG: prepilin-type N-terminal cleavage/methylation domain-containing protein [Gammaproteobacteria bacterium]|nr:prepilin-type N-terminal cleavage/methylation domain-containing protein [Gammaproteobacteria bacterium]
MMNLKRTNGFTLVELMIVVAIIGIIVAFGYPSYRDQVIKSRRADGMGALLELADRMERHYSDVGSYKQADDSDTTVADVFPGFSSSYYTLSIDSQDNIAFTVSASTAGSQTADKCGNFTLTSLGIKTVSGSLPVDDCWK